MKILSDVLMNELLLTDEEVIQVRGTCMVMGGRYHTLTTMAQLVIIRSR